MDDIEKMIASDMLNNFAANDPGLFGSGEKIIEVATECWEPITPERIMSLPIKNIPGIMRSADNQSFAVDADGAEWICGFFDGEICRVAVSKPEKEPQAGSIRH